MKYSNHIDKVINLSYQIKTAYNHWKTAPNPKIIAGDFPGKEAVIDSDLVYLQDQDNSIKLDSTLKAQFERAFDADFSDVRIHTGAYADKLTKSSGAEAVTIGRDIYFAGGKYNPETEDGIRLLAHELQHVIQFQDRESMNDRKINS